MATAPAPDDTAATGPIAAVQRARKRTRSWVTRETTGGALLIGAALIALVWANSPWRDAYTALSQTVIGPHVLHLDLTVAAWASDGLLALFFFVVGLELKHEFVAGSLRSPREAAVPMLAAVGGMALPAALYVVTLLLLDGGESLHGWAIPTATDIAFAVAVLAVFGKGLPASIRTFLLTLAVVDDLLAIIVIAIFYTEEIQWPVLGGALLAVAVFAWLARRPRMPWWLMLPVAAGAWGLMHASGIHATIAGVLLGFVVPAVVMNGEERTRVHRLERELRPVSSGLALPVFAFFAAGVTLVDGEGVGGVLGQPVVMAIAVALIVGKLFGVLGTTWLLTRLTPLRLAPGIGVRDLLPIAFLAGIGFTVSLLIAELSFEHGSEHTAGAKVAILAASVIAALLGALTLRWDVRQARLADMNRDNVPDEVGALIGDERDREEH
ncbi:Na+/H+ antiporter NhaA [Antribacter sp. KLBMP9083]|uniref:Na(+)/H(+) antiporter NhaA n=1 Tax=Antribacter soli TaxID=2910976 RepID=A0AA41UA80_9MICO|nr:Na+/H+ antiporter NhaA [Antribacter soli]MCF4122357.1 Na+/H+ antiporter NhaA [Antribacter soli]